MKKPRCFPYKYTELWRVGIAESPLGPLALDAGVHPRIHWLPDPGSYRLLADPFALRNADGTVTVYVEALDYRTKRGAIHYYQLDEAFHCIAHGLALAKPYHLSYPYLFRHEAETYMLPEASKSGKLTLYRAVRLPDQWEPVADLLDIPAIDATIIAHQQRWWMFFTLPDAPLAALHLAYADSPLGPWQLHPANPVHAGLAGSRPAGTPFVYEGTLYLPTQDCSSTYGGAVMLLAIEEMSTSHLRARHVGRLDAARVNDQYLDGLHTLSACDALTVFDVKHITYSPIRRLIDAQRRLRRLVQGRDT